MGLFETTCRIFLVIIPLPLVYDERVKLATGKEEEGKKG